MSRSHEHIPAYAILRCDHYLRPNTPVEHLVTVKSVVWSMEEAELEVARLNALVPGGGKVYYWQTSRTRKPSPAFEPERDDSGEKTYLLDALEEAFAAVSSDSVRFVYRSSRERPKAAAWIEASTEQRAGTMTIWDTGELDMQVLRLDDETLVMNEVRVLSAECEVVSAVSAFVWAVSYLDDDETRLTTAGE